MSTNEQRYSDALKAIAEARGEAWGGVMPSQSTATSAEKKLAIQLCSKIVSRWKFHVGEKSGVPCHLAVLDACQELRLPAPTWVAIEAGNRVTGAKNKKPKKRGEG